MKFYTINSITTGHKLELDIVINSHQVSNEDNRDYMPLNSTILKNLKGHLKIPSYIERRDIDEIVPNKEYLFRRLFHLRKSLNLLNIIDNIIDEKGDLSFDEVSREVLYRKYGDSLLSPNVNLNKLQEYKKVANLSYLTEEFIYKLETESKFEDIEEMEDEESDNENMKIAVAAVEEEVLPYLG